MSRVLVTGAAGFIGYHLCNALSKNSHDVIGIDNFNSYYDPALKRDRAKKLSSPIILADIRDTAKMKKLIEENQITHIIHLAAQAGVRHSITHPEEYLASNIEGFVSILECLKDAPHIKLIFASSSSVYGNNPQIPFKENDKTDNPLNLYGATKKASEVIAYSYHHLYNISMIGLRYFTVYGPWGRPDMAYYSFTKNILDKKPITLFNQGQMTRDFTYIDDIIEGTMASLNFPAGFEIFNLGNNNPVELMTFVSTLEKLLNKRAIIEFSPHQKADVPITFADISKSQKFLNFKPKTSLEEGLKQFVSWYGEYHSCVSLTL
jgi:UDP-glucuronate 4-epimerase